MCIVYCFLNPSPLPGKFKCILIMNRDEKFSRPTSVAEWKDDGILCGRDEEPGKAGGTWLGINKSGRIGFLTNIFTGSASVGEGRGHLIIDFLEGKDSAKKYLDDLAENESQFSPFNLILLETNETSGKYEGRKNSRIVLSNLKNIRQFVGISHVVETEGPITMVDSEIGISNHPYEHPFKKTSAILEHLRIVNPELNDVSQKEKLIEKLLCAMRDRNQYFPDSQMEKQAPFLPQNVLKMMSSPFSNVESFDYGTRTQTVILVDYENNVDFIELTRRRTNKNEEEEEKDTWSEVRKSFTLFSEN